MNLLRTERTYKTQANAIKALETALVAAGMTLESTRYLVAVTPEGRFAPVLVGQEYIPFAWGGITVVG